MRIRGLTNGTFEVTDQWKRVEVFDAVLVTCQSHLLSTQIDTEETAFFARAVDGFRSNALYAIS